MKRLSEFQADWFHTTLRQTSEHSDKIDALLMRESSAVALWTARINGSCKPELDAADPSLRIYASY